MENHRSNFNAGSIVLVMALGLLTLWPGLIQNLLVTSGFMPHGHCYLWKSQLVSLHLVSDTLIGLAYVSISITLAYLVKKARNDIPFDWVLLAFGAFIIACGVTHFMEVWTLWHPTYWLAGEVKLITAIASVTTAVIIPPLVPQVLVLIASAKSADERKLKLESANQELQFLYEKLKEIDQIKTQFFANISHELRTPLALILGPIERVLQTDGLNKNQRQKLETVRNNAITLLKHVNDLLDISKLEAEKMDVNYIEADLGALVRITVANFDTIAEDSQISLAVETPQSLPAQVDPEKLQRVLLNLLANAFKFTPAGGTVRCTLKQSGEQVPETPELGSAQVKPSYLTITVEDSGIGVPSELREVIFEPFRQAEGGSTRRFGGTGLGLAIAKEFVKLHSGTISVSDSPLGGAMFVVQLPLIAPTDRQIESREDDTQQNKRSPLAALLSFNPEQVTIQLQTEIQRNQQSLNIETLTETSKPKAQNSPLVLVVEDHPEMNQFIAETLGTEYSVVTAFNGNEALEKALSLVPDLIVSDVMMPQMSGDILVSHIRQHPQLNAIPIILLTAKADENLRVKLLREGVQDYLTKPFKGEELTARVSNLLSMKRTRDVLQQELDSQNQDLEILANDLANRKQELEKLALQLEIRVQERTAELVRANKSLTLEITARELAQQELEKSFSLLRATLDSTADGILVVDTQGKIVSFNQKFLDLWHLPISVVASLDNKQALRFVLPQLKAPLTFLTKVRELQKQLDLESYDILKFKDDRIFELYSLPQRIGGVTVGRVYSFRDITQRQRAEDELRRSESTLRSFYNSTSMMMGVVELAEDDIYHISDNVTATNFFGLTPATMQNRFASNLGVPINILNTWLNHYQKSEHSQSPVRFEYLHETADKNRWLAVTVCPILLDAAENSHNATQKPKSNRFSYVAEDITERKQAEERLRLLESVAVHANDSIIITEAEPIDEPGPRIIYVNNAFTQMTGYSEQEVLGKTPRILQGRKTDRATLNKIRAAMKKWQPTIVELINYRKDGSPFWVEVSIVPVADATGWYTHWIAIQRDISERKQAEEALYRSEQEFRALVENAPDVILRVNRENRYVYVNPAVEGLTGMPKSEFIGKNYRELGALEELSQLWDNVLERVFATGEEQDIEFQAPSLIGRRTYQARVVPELGKQGTTEYALVVSRDITELKQAEESIRTLNTQLEQRVIERTAQLEAANKELEQANRMKDEFLAIVSHELRTPLNAMLGWATLLRTRRFDETTIARALETIERNAKSQSQLIEDLLDVSRMIRGQIRLQLNRVDLSVIMEAAISGALPSAQAKSIDLQFQLLNPQSYSTENLKFFITGDTNRLQQVIWNLISNAIKFTPTGGKVDVRLSMECGEMGGLGDGEMGDGEMGGLGDGETRREEGEERRDGEMGGRGDGGMGREGRGERGDKGVINYAQIQVIDTGKGITPEFLPYVFDRFRQGDASSTRSYGGLGLGLAIVRHLVELHGGTVRADSEGEGKGATFTVRLPLIDLSNQREKPKAQDHSVSPLASQLQPLNNLRVLVITQQFEECEFLTNTLREYGAEAIATDSVQSALEALSESIIDVVVSDINMLGTDGYLLIQQIKKCETQAGKRIPAVAISADASSNERKLALDAGFQRCISKPVEPAQLVAAIATLVGRIKKL